MPYVVVDIETTGLSKDQHRITEIAAAIVENGKIIKEFQTLVNPECHIPSFITRLTGIDNEMVKDAPTIDKVMPKALKFFGKHTFVAHNAMFDHGFISHNAACHCDKEFCNETLCTRKLANRLLPDLPSKKLSALCEHFNVTNLSAHRAMGDVQATVAVFHHMQQMLAERGIQEHEEIVRFERMPRSK